MHGRCFDSGRCRLQVEQGATTTGAGDVVGLENAGTGRLQNVVAQTQGLSGGLLTLHENRIANAVTKERANVGGGDQESVKKCGASFQLAISITSQVGNLRHL